MISSGPGEAPGSAASAHGLMHGIANTDKDCSFKCENSLDNVGRFFFFLFVVTWNSITLHTLREKSHFISASASSRFNPGSYASIR